MFVFLLLSCSAVALAAGGDSAYPAAEEPAPEGAATSREPEEPAGVEIPAARTATSDTFRLQDGSREARIFGAPINYETPKGNWAPIEEELEPLPGGGLTNGANSFDLSLPDELGAEPVRLSSEGEWVSSQLLGPNSESAEVEGATASYEAALPGTIFELASTATGVEETIELANASEPSAFHYELDASQGLTPELEKDGSVVFRNKGQTVAAVLPPPTVTDSAPGAEPDPGAVSYELESLSGNRWQLDLTVNREWIEATGRVWPIFVDPTIEARWTPFNQHADCWYSVEEPADVSESNLFHCGGYGAPYDAVQLKAEYATNAGITQRSRIALAFDYGPIIPADSYIGSASLNLYSPEESVNVGNVEVHPATKLWNGFLTWYDYTYYFAKEPKWETPGGDFTAEASVVSTAQRGTGAGWWHFTNGMAPMVRRWNRERLEGKENNDGVILKLGEESPCGSSCRRAVIFDSESTTNPEVDRPYLSIGYYPKAPSTSKLVSPTEGTRTARRLKLKAKWTAAGVEGVTYQYREGKTGPFETIPAALVANAKGEAVTWPIPVSIKEHETKAVYFDAAHVTPSLRKTGGAIQVRALFEGPTEVAGYSAPVEADVNRSLGAADDATASVGPGSVDLLTGNFSTSHSDVSVPTFNSSLEFSRSFNSRGLAPKGSAGETEEDKAVLGPGWKPGVPVEEAGGSDWRNLKIVEEPGTYEEEIGPNEVILHEFSFFYATLTDQEGGELAFEKTAAGTYVAPPEATGWSLTTEGGNFVLSDPSGDRTTFSNLGEGGEYVPTTISQPAGGGVTTNRVEYELKEGKKRVHMVVAPTPSGISCTSQTEATTNPGCRALILTYTPATKWGAPAADGERLWKITYYAPGNGGPWEVANYAYNAEGRLSEEWDPRISPALKEKFTYEAAGALKTITPAGQEAWTLEYGTVDEEEGNGRLFAVKRPSLLASPTTAQTTIDYEVPLSGGGAPYEMGGTSVGQWGQTDIPVDGTAIFPPDQVPTARPPSSYSHATVYYMDAEGHEVNVATPSGAGTSNPSISTSETDEYGNVIRELTAQNRLRVLEKPTLAERTARWEELETRRSFGAEGTQMEEEEGPTHQVRLESGASERARFRKVVQYDKLPEGVALPSPDPHLPTRETMGARIGGVLHDERVTETQYDWGLRKPTKKIVVMASGEKNIESLTVYNDSTGLPTEVRQPKSVAESASPGTTKTLYYGPSEASPCTSSIYAGLRCETIPGAQTSGTGRPELPVTKYVSYDALEEPTEVVESPGGGAANVRKTLLTYDQAGRQLTEKIEGGGTAIPKTEFSYNAATGLPAKQQFASGSTPEATTTTYNKLGQVTEYEDANGNIAKTTYDVDGRPVTATDNKGSQTVTYDPGSGLPTKLVDSAAGTFTASYDADGNLVERTLPNGITAKTTYNEVDEPTKLSYTKTSSCGTGGCTWFEETLERSIYGQILTSTGSLAKDQYAYDKAGRLTQAEETAGGKCLTRGYTYDLDSNRLSKTTHEPGGAGECVTVGGTPQNYTYDAADRLEGTGLEYDAWGRITALPAVDAGGKALTASYFSDNMTASQSQGGVTNTFELDASLRPHQRVQAGGVAGIEISHFDSPSDSAAWTELGSTWSRNIPGIGGELAAVQTSGGTTTFDLTDLHGDVVAAASSSPTATSLLATYRYDEFGEPIGATAGTFGWLGGKQRRTELASGVVQMGARSYVPSLGRFLSPDSVGGGSANAYDYADQDPVNGFDLAGTCKGCGAIGNAKAVEKPQAPKISQARAVSPRETSVAPDAQSLIPSTSVNFTPIVRAAVSVVHKVSSTFVHEGVEQIESNAEAVDVVASTEKAVDIWIWKTFYNASEGHTGVDELIDCGNGAANAYISSGDPDDVPALVAGCFEGVAESF